jgi:MFS family permease
MIAGNEAIRENGPASTRFFLGVVASAVFVSVLTGSMVNVILPLMRAEFGVSAAQVGWVFTGFALAYAVSVPLYGRISDFFGIRRMFSVGLVGFATGGLICALAPNLPVLVLGRIVQAAGEPRCPRLRPSPPVHLDAAPFSDAFLAIVPALILALIAASGLRGRTKSK